LLMQEWRLPETVVDGVRDVIDVLVRPPELLKPARAARLALCYACARIGEKVAFGGLTDLDEFDLVAEEGPEYFFLKRYLARPELSRFREELRSSEIRAVIARVSAVPA